MMPHGYFTQQGFMGYIGTRAMLFASESDYLEFFEEQENSNCLISGIPEESHFTTRLESVSLF